MDAVDKTLEERGEVYGDYKGGTALRVQILALINERHREVRARPIDPLHQIYILDIINKLSRIATSPDHIDTWHDIAGYAKLTEEALQNEIQKSSSVN